MGEKKRASGQHSSSKGNKLSTKQLASRVWQESNADDIFGRSAQLAYYFFFAIFPLFVFLTALLGLFAGPGSAVRAQLADYLTRAMPPSASGVVHQTVQHTLDSSGNGKLSFGIIVALWSASAGMVAVMDTLNVVFGVEERRSWMRQKAVALGLTIATGILVCIAIALIVVGGNLANALIGGALRWVWQIAQYPVAVFFLLVSYSLIYYAAPNVEHPEWHWVTRGAAVGVFLWLVISFALREYLHFFNSYSSTYGSLGAVMVLLLWFYITGMAILIGGEVNSIVERAATGRPKPKVGGAEAAEAERPAA